MTHRTFNSAEEAGNALARELSEFLAQKAAEETPVLLALSGGSSLGFLEAVEMEHIGPSVTIMPVDERFDPTLAESNFARLAETDFFKTATKRAAANIDTRPSAGETQDGLAERWRGAIREWRRRHPTGIIAATLGMGPDGHIAGIMPFPENPERFGELFENDAEVSAYNATGKNPLPLRVTTTISFLRSANRAFGFVCGANKKSALEKALRTDGSLAEVPVRLFRELDGVVYTDIQLQS